MQKILKHRARIHYLKQTQELLKKYFITKTEEELLVQDKEIEKCIARKSLSFDEQIDVDTVITTKCNMELFFQGFPSMGTLPADFTLGSFSVTSSSQVWFLGFFVVVVAFFISTGGFFFCSWLNLFFTFMCFYCCRSLFI